jgi:hypothetical protein
LLRATTGGLEPRPAEEIEQLLKTAYGDKARASEVLTGLGVVAKALNAEDVGRAMVAAVRLRLRWPSTTYSIV